MSKCSPPALSPVLGLVQGQEQQGCCQVFRCCTDVSGDGECCPDLSAELSHCRITLVHEERESSCHPPSSLRCRLTALDHRDCDLKETSL